MTRANRETASMHADKFCGVRCRDSPAHPEQRSNSSVPAGRGSNNREKAKAVHLDMPRRLFGLPFAETSRPELFWMELVDHPRVYMTAKNKESRVHFRVPHRSQRSPAGILHAANI